MNESISILGGLTVGFLGSAHCIGMCGGIASALSLAIPPERRGTATLVAHHACYSLGRILSYAIAGGLAGAVGLVLGQVLGVRGGLVLRALAATLLVLLGLYLAGWWPGLAFLERQGERVWARLAPLTSRLRPGRSLPAAFALGMLWGWLPCGLVYSALALAVASGGPVQGALLMAAFGLGTLPATLATGLLAQRLTWLTRAPASRRVAGALMILFGVWTFAGGGAVALFRAEPPPPCHGAPK